MGRIFLSHSSKQKGYVEIVARSLGKQRIVYDAWTFEEGNKTLDEIYCDIDSTSLFVFLNISLINVDPNCCRKLIKYMALYLSFNLGCR